MCRNVCLVPKEFANDAKKISRKIQITAISSVQHAVRSIRCLKEGLPVDFFTQSILNLKPVQINRGDLHDKAQIALSDLRSIHGGLKEYMYNCENKIRTVCDLVRNQIEIATGSKIEFLNEYKNEMINEVDQYE
jgi:hypothetical protein